VAIFYACGIDLIKLPVGRTAIALLLKKVVDISRQTIATANSPVTILRIMSSG
jgi:hypothetical protein